MLAALALGAMSFGGSLLQGMGAAKASKKQAMLQAWENERVRQVNQERLDNINKARERLGRELLVTPESEESYERTDNSSWVDVDAMMAAAERSGFNPVTWLNAGGMQAYVQQRAERYLSRTHTNPVDAFKMMLPEYALEQAGTVPQQQSVMSALGGAISAGANAFGTQYRADQSYDLQMARMALGGINQGMGLASSNGLQTAYLMPGTAPRGGTKVTGGMSAGSRGSDDGDKYWPAYDQPSPQLWKNKEPEVTNPLPPSWGWTNPPGYANAEAYEDAYGEMVSWPYGVWKFGNMAMHNITGATIPTGLMNWYGGRTWSGAESKATEPVKPYVPAGMPAHLAYPLWARP